mmetsp:Transcript_3278/g.4379  ORF Transcript_3278/g.4379 Transcript_3278/m.4379 type:complete len:308 (-) Transcript_3278:1391-2314(-)
MERTKRLKLENWENVETSNWEFENVINLNVGGHLFTTALSTLLRVPDSMLGSFFSGRHKPLKDSEGRYLIDRDGTHFRHILNALRDGPSFELEIEDKYRKEFFREVRYYGLEEYIRPPEFSNTVSWVVKKLDTIPEQVDELLGYKGSPKFRITSPWLKFNSENPNHRYRFQFAIEITPVKDMDYRGGSESKTVEPLWDIIIVLGQDNTEPKPPLWPASGSLLIQIHSNRSDRGHLELRYHKRNPITDFQKDKEYKFANSPFFSFNELAESYGLTTFMKLSATYKPETGISASAETTAEGQLKLTSLR